METSLEAGRRWFQFPGALSVRGESGGAAGDLPGAEGEEAWIGRVRSVAVAGEVDSL